MDTIKNNAYECMFVTDICDATAEKVSKFVSLVKENGEIIDVTEWGKRRFEYPINDKNEGYYTIVTFRAPSAFPAELERLMNIDESVMRSIIVRLDEAEAEKVARRAADKAAAANAPAAEEAAPAESTEAPAAEAAQEN